jgi:hypothetical protein
MVDMAWMHPAGSSMEQGMEQWYGAVANVQR